MCASCRRMQCTRPVDDLVPVLEDVQLVRLMSFCEFIHPNSEWTIYIREGKNKSIATCVKIRPFSINSDYMNESLFLSCPQL